jgi:uncharacterized protein YaaN involved in tellurite resistance
VNTDSEQPLELIPPKTVSPVTPEGLEGLVKISPEKRDELDSRVKEFLSIILSEPPQSDAFKTKVEGVHTLANSDIKAAAQISNRLLDQPEKALQGGLFNESSPISKSLIDLRRTIESLDPTKETHLLNPRKWLGIIPRGASIQDYFRRYQSAQSHLDAILKALYEGQDELRKDNAAVEEEKVHAWAIMERLEQYIYIGKKIDSALTQELADIDAKDQEKARIIREELLFYIRQKVQDLLTQLAVTVQGYLAMDMVQKNNLELIKGVDRATTTTVSALRTAIIVAQALSNQKLVLNQIGALNNRTSDLIASTSTMMKHQAGAIHTQATSATLDIEHLKGAFENIYATMDMVASYKIQALDNMHKTVETLSIEVEKSKAYLDRTRDPKMDETLSSLATEVQDPLQL